METIAAIATAHGIGSIGVIRLSGPKALSIAKTLCRNTKELQARVATLAGLYDSNGDMIDEAILIYFKAPHSFTAEDIVEFQCHGGIVVAEMILSELLKNGARLAQPGEFSKRAFLNGRIDLSEAEAIAKLIETKSIDAAKILAKQMKGEIKEFVHAIREDLVEVLAFVEVNIDYAEEDLPQDLIDQIEQKLQALHVQLKMTYESSKRREGLIEGFKVSIVGKPNVGKSSLLNALLRFDRAIISDIAGTTRDTIEEQIRIGTHLIKIVDTAGIREASDTIEKIGIQRSKEAIEQSDIVICMLDNSRELENEDKQILQMMEEYSDKELIYVLNKCDLEKKIKSEDLSYDFVHISCKNDVEIVVQRLEQILDQSSNDETLLLSSKRQMEAVRECYENIDTSRGLINEGELELFAFHLNDAIRAIASITSNFERDEILDKMFGNFCLGK